MSEQVPPPDYIKYLPISEFREMGLVQEINRLILHPLGLALEIKVDDQGEHLSGVWDFRDDPEGIVFDEGYLSAEKAQEIANTIEYRGRERLAALGYVIQPLPVETKQLNVTVKEHVSWQETPEQGSGVADDPVQ